MQLICLVRKLLIMTSKLGAYLKTKEATGTTSHTDLPNPNADLNPNSSLAVKLFNWAWDPAACCRGSDQAAQPNKTEHCVSLFGDVSMFVDNNYFTRWKLTHGLFGGPLRLGGPGPAGPLDKTALSSPIFSLALHFCMMCFQSWLNQYCANLHSQAIFYFTEFMTAVVWILVLEVIKPAHPWPDFFKFKLRQCEKYSAFKKSLSCNNRMLPQVDLFQARH